MKSTLLIIGILALLVMKIYLIGKVLPQTNEVVVEIKINAPADKVWSVMTSWEEQPLWRSGIERVKTIDSSRFIEYPKKGAPISFNIISAEQPEFLKMEFSGSVNGIYVAELIEDEGVTLVRSTESVSIGNPFFRVVSKLFFDLEEFARSYQAELKSHVERSS